MHVMSSCQYACMPSMWSCICVCFWLTCLKCLQSTLLTTSEGLTFPDNTEERRVPRVTTPRIPLCKHTHTQCRVSSNDTGDTVMYIICDRICAWRYIGGGHQKLDKSASFSTFNYFVPMDCGNRPRGFNKGKYKSELYLVILIFS